MGGCILLSLVLFSCGCTEWWYGNSTLATVLWITCACWTYFWLKKWQYESDSV